MRQRDQLPETQSQCCRPHRPVGSPTRSLPDPKFRHPGHDELRAVVRAAISDAGLLAEDDALALVAHGLREVALRMAVSERTIRRRFDAAGKPVHTVVHRVRIEVTRSALVASVPTTVTARWLGFTNPEAYRRFVRREMGASIREIKVHVCQSAEFRAPGVASDPAHPTLWNR
jgi:AraC-like DNA-binding protein